MRRQHDTNTRDGDAASRERERPDSGPDPRGHAGSGVGYSGDHPAFVRGDATPAE